MISTPDVPGHAPTRRKITSSGPEWLLPRREVWLMGEPGPEERKRKDRAEVALRSAILCTALQVAVALAELVRVLFFT